jgi:hypothetical protein
MNGLRRDAGRVDRTPGHDAVGPADDRARGRARTPREIGRPVGQVPVSNDAPIKAESEVLRRVEISGPS